MKSNYKRIGNYIQLVDERNTGLKVKNLLGLSISKGIVESHHGLLQIDNSRSNTTFIIRFPKNNRTLKQG